MQMNIPSNMTDLKEDTNLPIAELVNDVDVTETDSVESDFQQVDLEIKEYSDVLDEELEKVDLEANDENIDSLFKDQPIDGDKRTISRRGRLCSIITVLIGFTLLIILIVSLIKSEDSNVATKQTATNKDKATVSDTSPKVDETNPKFMCASTATTCSTLTNTTWTKLTNDILGEANKDYAGYATALSCDGSVIAISSLYNNNETGHVRMFQFEKSAQAWVQMGNDIDGTEPGEDFGNSLSMSSDGYQIAIGSRFNSDKATKAGEVRVFSYLDHEWQQRGQDLQGEYGGDEFGRSVSLSADGSRLAIGGSSNNGTASGAGHARVFEVINTNGIESWVQLGQDLDGEFMGDQFGRSVALSGDGRRVAVGATTHDGADGTIDTGHVRVFEYDDIALTWTQLAADIDGVKEKEYFGVKVSLSYDGSRVAVGSPDSDGYMFGVTRVFELSNDSWTQLGSNLLGGGKAISLTMDGTRVAIGSNSNFANGMKSGHVSVYEYVESISSWSQIGGDINGNMGEASATSIALSADGKRVVSSAPSGFVNGTDDNGVVRVYDFC